MRSITSLLFLSFLLSLELATASFACVIASAFASFEACILDAVLLPTATLSFVLAAASFERDPDVFDLEPPCLLVAAPDEGCCEEADAFEAVAGTITWGGGCGGGGG